MSYVDKGLSGPLFLMASEEDNNVFFLRIQTIQNLIFWTSYWKKMNQEIFGVVQKTLRLQGRCRIMLGHFEGKEDSTSLYPE